MVTCCDFDFCMPDRILTGATPIIAWQCIMESLSGGVSIRVFCIEVVYKSPAGDINKLISYQDINKERRNDKSKNHSYHHLAFI